MNIWNGHVDSSRETHRKKDGLLEIVALRPTTGLLKGKITGLVQPNGLYAHVARLRLAYSRMAMPFCNVIERKRNCACAKLKDIVLEPLTWLCQLVSYLQRVVMRITSLKQGAIS